MRRAVVARSRRARAAVVALLGVLTPPALASAAGPLGPDGAPIRTSDYKLDLFQGPILASSRVTAMGGAYSGLAEGPEGIPFNAAAASQRHAYSTTSTDWDLTGGLTFPAAVAATDFDNNGRPGFGYRNFVFASGGALLQHDHWGVGSVISLQNYSLGKPRQIDPGAAPVKDLTVRLFKVDAVASYAMMDDQLHVGGGVRGVSFTAVDTSSTESLLFGTYGVGGQAGALWRPRQLPLRFGVTVRSPVIASLTAGTAVAGNGNGDRVIGQLYLPSGVALPWEAEWGVAVQIGPRPLNIPWVDEDTVGGPEVELERHVSLGKDGAPQLEPRHKAARRLLQRRYAAIPRRKLLLSLSMLVTGPTEGAVGVESMLTQRVDRSGEKSNVTMRAGGEIEVIPNAVQLRAGSYMEPTRFRGSTARLHATTGFELRLVRWTVFGLFPDDNVFSVGGAFDVSREYFGWGLGISSWH